MRAPSPVLSSARGPRSREPLLFLASPASSIMRPPPRPRSCSGCYPYSETCHNDPAVDGGAEHARRLSTARESFAQNDGPQDLLLTVRGAATATPVACSRSKTRRTAIEPSPIAVAVRLIEPLRTSPTQKIPGRDVSSNSGGCPHSPPTTSGLARPPG